MHKFDDLNEITLTLQRLIKREPPLAAVLARQPGTKEARYAQLLSGPVQSGDASEASHASAPVKHAVSHSSAQGDSSRVAALESEIAALREELGELKRQFAEFKQQFQ